MSSRHTLAGYQGNNLYYQMNHAHLSLPNSMHEHIRGICLDSVLTGAHWLLFLPDETARQLDETQKASFCHRRTQSPFHCGKRFVREQAKPKKHNNNMLTDRRSDSCRIILSRLGLLCTVTTPLKIWRPAASLSN